MPLMPMAALLKPALKNGFTVGAYNVYDLDSVMAVLEAASQTDSPVILQVSMGARKHVGNLALFLNVLRLYANACSVPVSINHDHVNSFEDAAAAADMGFPSVMYDCSHLPYEENVAAVKRFADYAHAKNVWVESELGCLPGFEDMVFSEKARFTDPAMAKDYVKRTGCDALAVSVGTSHGGVRADGPLPLDFQLLGHLHELLPGLPMVLHGAASVPEHLVREVNNWGGMVEQLYNCSEEDIAKCGRLGVCKANMDVDNHLAYTAAVRQSLTQNPGKYDPRSYLRPAREAFMREVSHKMQAVSGSAGWAAKYGT
jgi:fructose-bisphosphate aldolase, class II